MGFVGKTRARRPGETVAPMEARPSSLLLLSTASLACYCGQPGNFLGNAGPAQSDARTLQKIESSMLSTNLQNMQPAHYP